MLQKLIDEKFNGSQVDFCRRSGKKEAQVTQWLNGHRNMKDVTAREIELDLGLEQFYFEDASRFNRSNEINLENNSDYPTIKKVSLKVSAGITGFTIDSYEPDTTLQAFKAEWFTKNGFIPSKMLALTVSGESMEPTLYDGDTVVINTADTTLKDGEVFVFNLDGEVVIKRAVKDSGQWWLDSDNKNNTRFTRKACPEGICIPIGRVVQKQSMRI
jgi:phage repressor protein C with HTH and peptisase S24 domain